MDYARIYNALIKRSIGRTKLAKTDINYVYYERHHIIPKCLGGNDAKDNLVYLTAEEHWVAHLLLVKINPGVSKLVWACQAMSMSGGNNKRMNNKMFGWIRRQYSNAVSERNRGRVVTPEQREKASKALKGRPAPHQLGDNNVSKRPEVAHKISISNTGKKHGPRPDDVKEKIRLAKKGKPNLPGELNPAFKGWIVATSLTSTEVLRLATKKDMDEHGFCKSMVYRAIAKKRPYKGYSFTREEKG